MQLKKVEITDLMGIDDNAVEGVTQTAPVEIKGFNFGKTGGYFAEFAKGSTSVVSSVPAQLLANDDFGIVLFANDLVLHGNTLSDQSSGSINGLPQYLVPNVGVGTNPEAGGGDQYSLGGFARDLPTNAFRDLPRVSGITLSAAGSGGTIDDTLDHRILVFFSAPTENGFLTYQSLVDDLGSGSITSGENITVTADSVLPRGYEMRAFMSDGFAFGTAPTKYLVEETSGNVKYSDGENAMAITFTTDSSSGSNTAAILSFDQANAVVEPHLQRVWGKADADSLLGPYVPTTIAQNFIYGDPQLPSAISTDAGTTSGTDLDTAFNGSAAFTVRADLSRNPIGYINTPSTAYYSKEIYIPTGHSTGTHTFKFYFARRYMDSGVVQFGAGIQVNIILSGSGTKPRPITIREDPFIEYNGTVKTITSPTTYSINASSTSSINFGGNTFYAYQLYLNTWSPRLDFKVDLSGGTFEMQHKDLNDVVIYGGITSFGSTTLPSAGVTATPIYVMAYDLNETSFEWISSLDTPGASDVWSTWNTATFISYFQVEAHNTVGVTGTPIAAIDADDWDGTSTTVTDSTTGVVWTGARETPTSVSTISFAVDQNLVATAAPSFSILNPNSTLLYSEQGYVNYANEYTNYLEFRFLTSTEITALSSTPAGLLVFGENETFLVRGDPALVDLGGEFSNQRLSGVIGCDPGKRPARLGSAVFVIHQGRLYGINLGAGDVDFGSNLADIGQPVYDPEDPFVQVIGDPVHRQIVVRTQFGRILRFSTIYNKWLTDVFDGDAVDFLYPSVNAHSSRYVISGSAFEHVDVPVDPSVKWENVNLGDKGMRKLWRRVRLFTSDDYSGTPELNYVIGSSTGTITASEEGSGWWVFTLPNGLVSEKAASLEVVMKGAAFGDEFAPPVIIEYVDRYSRR